MRIAIPTNGGGFNDSVAPVFARAPAFYIADIDENGNVVSEKVVQNPASTAGGGAGPMAVQALINEGVEAIVAPQVGPNALGALQAAGIKLYQVNPGTPVRNAVEALLRGELPTASVPQEETGPGYGPGTGRGMGRGMGRGRRHGGGWGRGRGGW